MHRDGGESRPNHAYAMVILLTPVALHSGVLGDKYDLRKMIAGGMWATAGVVLMFGLGAFADIHALSFYATLWGLNGLIQSSGWPSNVAVMYAAE